MTAVEIGRKIKQLRIQKGLTLEAYCQFTGSDEKKLREDMRPDALEAFRCKFPAWRDADDFLIRM